MGVLNETKAALCGICQTSKKTGSSKPSLLDISEHLGNADPVQSISHGNVDKRVSLTVSPKKYDRDETFFVNKVKYVLGKGKVDIQGLKNGAKSFFGLLRNALGS